MDTSKDQERFDKIREIESVLYRCDTYSQYCGRLVWLKLCISGLNGDKEIRTMYECEVKKLDEKYKTENEERMMWI